MSDEVKDRQTDKQTDRKTDRQTDVHTLAPYLLELDVLVQLHLIKSVPR